MTDIVGEAKVKVLLAVKGNEPEAYFARVAKVSTVGTAGEVVVAHVVDITPRGGLETGRERFLGRRRLAEQRSGDVAQAEEERARGVLQFAHQSLVVAGVPDDRIREVVLRGKPNEELRRMADSEGTDLIVVQGRSEKPGPHSLGKTARFLIDHAPRAALLVR
ncbi:MAG: universal stress protein [Chloroflexota bacterium]|nr:MAG: hypothetical protein DLM70_11800 [Chloroflexota bacterium]